MARLAPGFRFHPTDVELVMYYLKRKIMGKKLHFEGITDLNIYNYSPWDLPDKCCYKSKDLEWYFFCPRQRKYASGGRMNRATETGYWKTTGKDRHVTYDEKIVGSVKTLVFHRGHPPKGQRTDWVIHEYKFEDKESVDAGFAQDSYVLSKVFQKSGPGPKNGAQYGAPFKEEDWEDDTVPAEPCPSDVFPSPTGRPDNLTKSVVTGLVDPGSSTSDWPSSEPSLILPEKHSCSACTSLVKPGPGPSNDQMCTNETPFDEQDDEIFGLLAHFTEDTSLLSVGDETNQNLGNFNRDVNAPPAPLTDGNDIFFDLEDIEYWAGEDQPGSDLFASGGAGYSLNPMILPQDAAYVELKDLDLPLDHSADTTGTGQLVPGNFCVPYNSNNDMQQLCFGSNSLGIVQDFGEHHLPRLPESYTQQVYNFQNNACQGHNAATNFTVSSFKQPEESRLDTQNLERGAQQRKFCLSIFALCEGSFILVKAEVTLGVDGCTDDALSVVLLEQRKLYSSIFALYGGSFILVKAEVTLGIDGCTDDALSVVLVEQRKLYSSTFALCGGSFILVKAEVTLGVDGCTDDALSVLGEQSKLYWSIFALCGGSFVLVKAEVSLGVDGCTDEALSVILGDPCTTFNRGSKVDKADFLKEVHDGTLCFGFSLAFIYFSHLEVLWFNLLWKLYQFIFLKILLNQLQFNSSRTSFHLHFHLSYELICSAEFDNMCR